MLELCKSFLFSFLKTNVAKDWKWSNKTFPHTLCVVSTSDETTHCGIFLTSNKNPQWASELHFLGQFSPCLVNSSESRLTVKNLFT